MTDTHTTLERLKSANAVPSTDSLPSGALSSVGLLARIDERNRTMTETTTVGHSPDAPEPPTRRGALIALGVAAAVLLLVGGLSLLSTDQTELEPAQRVPTTEAAPDYATARETLDAWATATGAGDVDAAMATHSFDPDEVEAGRESLAYLAATVSHAEFNDCEFSTVPSGDIVVRCDLTLIDPILVAIEMDTVPVTWRLSHDGKSIIASAPGDRLTAKNLSVPYAQEHYPDEFVEACGPGTVNYNAMTGWGFNRACGEFSAKIASEVADAINEAG